MSRLAGLGHSQRSIAIALGISRRRVKEIREEIEKRRKQGETAVEREIRVPIPRGSKLDEYEDLMREWIEAFGKKLTAVRCLEKLEEHGISGKHTIVREWLKKLRLEMIPPQPTATEVVTAPGQRGEFDWSPWSDRNGVRRSRVEVSGPETRFDVPPD